jgi:hypothetical protein
MLRLQILLATRSSPHGAWHMPFPKSWPKDHLTCTLQRSVPPLGSMERNHRLLQLAILHFCKVLPCNNLFHLPSESKIIFLSKLVSLLGLPKQTRTNHRPKCLAECQ